MIVRMTAPLGDSVSTVYFEVNSKAQLNHKNVIVALGRYHEIENSIRLLTLVHTIFDWDNLIRGWGDSASVDIHSINLVLDDAKTIATNNVLQNLTEASQELS